MSHCETSIVTANARHDFIFSVFHEFCYPFRINQKLSSNSHCINLVFLDCFCTGFWIHSSSTNNWHCCELLDVSNVFQITVFRHIARRMCPIPCIIGSVVAVEHVIACFFKMFDCFFTFFHVSSSLCEFFTWKSTFAETFCFAGDWISERNREIQTTLCFDFFNDVCCKTISIFKRATIFICSKVCVFCCELVEKISFMNGMDFNTINTCFFAESCCFAKCIDNFFDFFHRNLSAHCAFCPSWWNNAWRCWKISNINDWFDKSVHHFTFKHWNHCVWNREWTAKTRCELNKKFCTCFVELFHESFQFFKHFFILIKPTAKD